MKTFRASCRWLLVALALTLASGGCSGKKEDENKDKGGDQPGASKPTVEVSGTVTLADGKPLPAGWIAFHGKDASETALATVADGKFLARGVPTGDAIRVTVDGASAAKEAADLNEQIIEALTRDHLMKQVGKTDAALQKRLAEMKKRHAQLTKLIKEKGGQVDPRFLLAETTLLRFPIAAGTQKLDIPLKP